MSLTINMEMYLDIDNSDGEFAIQLLNVENGLLDQDSHNQIQLPFQTLQTEDELITSFFRCSYPTLLITNGSLIKHF